MPLYDISGSSKKLHFRPCSQTSRFPCPRVQCLQDLKLETLRVLCRCSYGLHIFVAPQLAWLWGFPRIRSYSRSRRCVCVQNLARDPGSYAGRGTANAGTQIGRYASCMCCRQKDESYAQLHMHAFIYYCTASIPTNTYMSRCVKLNAFRKVNIVGCNTPPYYYSNA